MPGSASTSRSSASGRGRPRVAGQDSIWSRLANPVEWGVAVTGAARASAILGPGPDGAVAGVVEPEQADGPRTGVRADDRAERRPHLDRRVRAARVAEPR